MRIRTQFLITMLVFGIALVAISVSAIVTSQQVGAATEQLKLANSVAQGASELSYLSNDYLIYRESQQLSRWQSRFASFSTDVASLHSDKPKHQALLRNIQANQRRVKEVFDSTVSAVGSSSQDQVAAIAPAFLQVSWSRMAVQSQELVSDASRLSQLLRDQVDETRQANLIVVFAMMGVFGAYFLATYFIVHRRVLQSIAELRAGTLVIGSGNLGFIMEERRHDEIGELAHAFNEMTGNLRVVTASKADLEREIAERKRAEAERERLLATVQDQAEELQTQNEELESQSEELQSQSEELHRLLEELRESEGKYRNLFTNMTEEVHFWQLVRDEEGRIVTWRLVDANPPTLKTWGRGTVEEIRGRTTDEIFGPGATEHYMAVVQRIMTEGVPYVFEDYFPNLDKHFRFTSVPLGEYFITTGADITTIKKAHETLLKSEGQVRAALVSEQEARHQAEAAVKVRDEFISVASHELKTPVTSLAGYAQLITRQYERTGTMDPERLAKALRQIRIQSAKLTQLTEQLLDLSRLETGRLALARQELDIAQLVRGTIDSVQHAHPERVLDLQDGETLLASVDPLRIEQVLTNLLDNAIKFSPSGSPVVVELAGAEGWAEIAVRDYGIGIPEEKLEHIFEAFYQAHPERHLGGMGIGLHIGREMVEMHGGSIRVEQPEDGGSRFVVRLPLRSVKGEG